MMDPHGQQPMDPHSQAHGQIEARLSGIENAQAASSRNTWALLVAVAVLVVQWIFDRIEARETVIQGGTTGAVFLYDLGVKLASMIGG